MHALRVDGSESQVSDPVLCKVTLWVHVKINMGLTS